MVVCRDGFGKLVSESEDSLTISLEPWQFEKTYSAVLDTEGDMGTARGQARLARWEPSLDEYEREERSDTVPAEWKEAIEKFHRAHNHTSPNCKDPARRQHPRYPAQKQEAPRIYRYESWDQLWSEFQKDSPGIANKIINTDHPTECPTLI